MNNTREVIPLKKRYDDVKLSAEYTESRLKYPKFVFETVLDYVKESVSILYKLILTYSALGSKFFYLASAIPKQVKLNK